MVHRRYVREVEENVSAPSEEHFRFIISSPWDAVLTLSGNICRGEGSTAKRNQELWLCIWLFLKPEGEDRKVFPSPSSSNTSLIRLLWINKLLNSVLSSLLWMIFERINVIKKPIEWRMHSRTRSFLIVVNIISDSILVKSSSMIIFQKMAQFVVILATETILNIQKRNNF